MLHEHIFIKNEITKKNYERVELSDLFVVFLSKDEYFYYVSLCTNYKSNLNNLKKNLFLISCLLTITSINENKYNYTLL